MMVPILVVEDVILPDSPAAVVASCIRRRSPSLATRQSALQVPASDLPRQSPVGPQLPGRETTRINAE